MESRIFAVYESATADHIRRGTKWYRDYRATAIANGDGFTPAQICGMVGVSSINTNPAQGMNWIRKFASGQDDRGHLDLVTYRGHVILIEMGAASFDEIRDLAGDPKSPARKVRNFSCNTYTAGKACRHVVPCVTIDRWANRVATNEATAGVPSGSDYDTVANAYREVARLVNLPPAVLQAIVWVVVAEPDGPKK